MTVLLLPAGGKAERFGGLIKELLPITQTGMTLLESTIWNGLAHFPITEIVILTNAFKRPYQEKALSVLTDRLHIPVTFKEQSFPELWYALQDGIEEDRTTVLMLPDTVVEFEDRFVTTGHDFSLGTFFTNEPERFSVLEHKKIVTKQRSMIPARAWGAMYWSGAVSSYLKSLNVSHYDEAFNKVIDRFGFDTFHINEYYDLASMEYYLHYLGRLTK